MYARIKISIIALSLLIAGNAAAQTDTDAILSAIQKEVTRSMDSLRIKNMRPPFFIDYTVVDTKVLSVSASLGSIVNEQEYTQRFGNPTILVGDYSRANDPSSMQSRIPLDNTAVDIETGIWRDMDLLYKNAAESYEAKLAAIARQKIDDEDLNLPEMEQTPPVQVILPPATANFDKKYWENYVAKASETVNKYPEIVSSSVSAQVNTIMTYTYNTEGTKLAIPSVIHSVSMTMSALADDGMSMSNSFGISHTDFEKIPTLEKFIDTCEVVISKFISSCKAPTIKNEAYAGPVLFERSAVSQTFLSLFFNSANSLRAVRKPLLSNFGGGNTLEVMKDKKIISRDLSVTSMSGTQSYKGEKLVGYFPVDAQGVAPKAEEVLVENGVLRGMLNGRTPTRKFQHSNGHMRRLSSYGTAIYPGVARLSSTKTFPTDSLKKMLLAAAKEEDYEYAYIVRRYPSEVYRIYVSDGHEELVRGVRFPDYTMKSYKRVLGASDTDYIDNIVSVITMSFIVPEAILFEELEVVHNDNAQLQKPYIAPQPQPAATPEKGKKQKK
ncbi:MAG: hypothetical protein LBR06_05510 [Bacteroidales bacterium]|nr:hypothetical protein [Bacteroidales bacterium]